MLFHDRLATDENMKLRGQVGVSMCYLCGMAEESSDHLLLQCDDARSLWIWLGGILQVSIDISSVSNIFASCSKSWSSEMRDVVNSVFIHILWIIRHFRNLLKFKNKGIFVLQAQNRIIANVSITGNLSNGTMFNDILEFVVFCKFHVVGHPTKAPKIRQVTWYPSPCCLRMFIL